MNNINVLTSTDAEGGLPALPHLRFNKDGNLLAVTTADNGFKILANPAGFRSLRAMETPASETMRTPVDFKAVPGAPVASVNCKVERGSPVRHSQMLNGVDPSKSRIDDSTDKPKSWQLAEILDPSQCFPSYFTRYRWFFHKGCSASVYEFRCWNLGTRFQWYPETLEVGSQ